MRLQRLAGLLAPILAIALTVPAGAQEFHAQTARPKLLIHGHYCGPGNDGPGVTPIDALDAACMRHDACTPDVGLPTCGCNQRLKREAGLVAASPRQPDDVRMMAGFVAQGSDMMICRDSMAALQR